MDHSILTVFGIKFDFPHKFSFKKISNREILNAGHLAIESFAKAVQNEPLAFIGGISVTAISIAAFKFYQKLIDFKIMNDGRVNFCKCTNRVRDRVVVITGGTSGIGREVVVDCAKKGAKIVVGCRDMVKGGELMKEIKRFYDVDVTVFIVDFRSLRSCKQFAENVIEKYPKIDFLVNNAGVFNVPYQSSEDNFEITWQTNFFGHVVITENLWDALIPVPIPGLRRVDEDRNRNSVIFVSSRIIESTTQENLASVDQSKFCEIPDEGDFLQKIQHYGLSKLGLWNYSKFLSRYAGKKEIDIEICSVDPGTCYTPIYDNTFEFFSFKRLLHYMGTRTAKEGAQSIIHCLNKKFNIYDRAQNGSLYRNCDICTKVQDKDEVLGTQFLRKSLALITNFIPPLRFPSTDPETSLG